ncbi:MucR family transcriptional regulator [Novosphingobium sp. 9U]|uniref:MucR family transcriptional regulator n=1 Tax=Novosphingobium sp. 9U TaxID=2653158 RepID=UPI0012F371B1|nr:MucR family transcriptional regulator [Novosphingobium sp. 9U]VWX49727.1 Transcriptional regulatory protein rosAr [Novosphingobium sp. 9U]
MSADLLSLTTEIITSHLSNNKTAGEALPKLISDVYAALSSLGQEALAEEAPVRPEAAVTIRRSLADPKRIVSMIDGKPYASLKRHLATHGYTPESYRATFGLKPDYPMVAPSYVEKRREIAKQTGLGRRPKSATPTAPAEEKKVRTPRKAKGLEEAA